MPYTLNTFSNLYYKILQSLLSATCFKIEEKIANMPLTLLHFNTIFYDWTRSYANFVDDQTYKKYIHRKKNLSLLFWLKHYCKIMLFIIFIHKAKINTHLYIHIYKVYRHTRIYSNRKEMMVLTRNPQTQASRQIKNKLLIQFIYFKPLPKQQQNNSFNYYDYYRGLGVFLFIYFFFLVAALEANELRQCSTT